MSVTSYDNPRTELREFYSGGERIGWMSRGAVYGAAWSLFYHGCARPRWRPGRVHGDPANLPIELRRELLRAELVKRIKWSVNAPAVFCRVDVPRKALPPYVAVIRRPVHVVLRRPQALLDMQHRVLSAALEEILP